MECKDHGRTKSLRPEGYAMVGIPGVPSRCVNLHRLVYCEANGLRLEDIQGKVVRHTCDNPRCIEPTHLLIGTRADNNRDRAERGRSAKTVPSRQRFTADEVRDIRALYNCGNSKARLAEFLGVDFNVIHRIIIGTYACTESS